MAARTRWVQYTPSSEGTIGDGRGEGCKGTNGFVIGTASVGDTFNIGGTTNRLYLSMDGDSGPYITMYSGADLDPRFIARDVTEKMRNLGKSDARWDQAFCEWGNAFDRATGTTYENCFKIYSGTLGSASSAVVTSGTNSGHTVLGFGTSVTQGGTANHSQGAYNFSGDATVSGTYYGLFDEIYKVVISNDNDATRGIATPTKDGSNSYDGTLTTGGAYNNTADLLYTIAINTANGSTMGAGTGNVPLISWTSTGSADDSTTTVELLYPNHWYNIGTKGLMIKFTDAVFNTVSPAWTIQCYKPDYAQGSNATAAVGSAEYIWSSNRGDMSSAPVATVSGSLTQLGIRGARIQFDAIAPNWNLAAGDEFYVYCSGPTPSTYNITSLNYGNVTVSTESDVKSVMFEVEAGAVEISTVKFGLQSHGTFSHHDAGNSDTMFRFGTMGPTNNAGSGLDTGMEWYPGIVAADIDSDTPPSYLYATKEDLAVVATADNSEAVGSLGLTGDAIWLNIKLGTAETGANSTINNRLYFDYS